MRSDYRIWHIIEGLRESLGDALSGLSLNTQEITSTKNRIRDLEATPIGGVTSYNDLTDKPTIPVLADISKTEIEAKLTGEISSHTHAGGGGGLSQQQIEGLI